MIYASVKATLKTLLSNPMSAFMLVLFPILMVMVMSFTQSDAFSHEIEDLNIPIAVIDEDKTQVSDSVRFTLQSPQLAGVVKMSEKPDFTITIPKGYRDALENKTPLDMRIDGIPDASSFNGRVIHSIMASLNLQYQNRLRTEAAMKDPSLTADEALQLRDVIRKIQTEPAVKVKKYEPKVTLTAKENFSTQYLQLVFLVFITSYAASFKQLAETTDLGLRMKSMPQSMFSLQLGEFSASFVQTFMFSTIYVLLLRLMGWGFPGSPAQYIISLFVISLFVSALAMFFAELIPPKFSTVLMTAIMMFFMFFGGMTGPSHRMYQGTPFEFIGNLNISRLLIGPVMEVNLGTFTFASLSGFLIATVVCFALTFVINRIKRGVFE